MQKWEVCLSPCFLGILTFLKISHTQRNFGLLLSQIVRFMYLKIIIYTLKVLPFFAPKRSTDLLATKSRPKLHQILLLSEIFIIFWCNSPLVIVQLRTNFCSQQISAAFLVQHTEKCFSV